MLISGSDMARRAPHGSGLATLAVLAVLCIGGCASSKPGGEGAAGLPRPTAFSTPFSFVPNRGQADSRITFMAQGGAGSLFLLRNGFVVTLVQREVPRLGDIPRLSRASTDGFEDRVRAAALRFQFIGAQADPAIKGVDPQPGRINYIIGNDPARWATSLPHYRAVRYAELYPGIDLVFHADRDELKYDLLLAAGVDAKRIRFKVEGARSIAMDGDGALVLRTAAGELVQPKPHLYQRVDGEERAVAGGYVLHRDGSIGFEVGTHDPSRALVIDPPIKGYSTYLESYLMQSIAVDLLGSAYAAGIASSGTPVDAGTIQNFIGMATSMNMVLAKLNPIGSAFDYVTIIGGTGSDRANAVTLDQLGRIYLTGSTDSPGSFPGSPALLKSPAETSIVVVGLAPDGASLNFSVVIGGSGFDRGASIAVDPSGLVYVTGMTTSADFPVSDGAFRKSLSGASDAFAIKLDPSGDPSQAMVYATYLGGAEEDSDFFERGVEIVADASGEAVIMGVAQSADFPVTPNAFDRNYHGNGDLFVTRLNGNGSSVISSTYLGGENQELAGGMALDSAGDVYVCGTTSSRDFPMKDSMQPLRGFDAFVTKLSRTGGDLVYSTFLGGDDVEYCWGIAVNAVQEAHVTGETDSDNFPTVDAYQAAIGGDEDAFVSKLRDTGQGLRYSTYLGGSEVERGTDITLDSNGDAYISGSWASFGETTRLFPTTKYAYRTTPRFPSFAAVAAKLTELNARPDLAIARSGDDAVLGGGIVGNVSGQTTLHVTSGNVPARYRLFLSNATGDDRADGFFMVAGAENRSGWTVTFRAGASGQIDITGEVMGSGWKSGSLAPGETRVLRLEVIPDETVPLDETIAVTIEAVSIADSAKRDAVRALTTKVAP